MYKLRLAFFITCTSVALLPAATHAQGINFVPGLSWQQVKEKATREKKYILLDCYATWCGPCKRMDREVFTDTAVGSFINEHFIPIKVQMDKTFADNPNVQSWYQQVDQLRQDYSVNAFPTYLFFSPDGRAVHKSLGFQDPASFLQHAKDAMDPQKQFYTMLDKYNIRQLDTMELKAMARKYLSTDAGLAENFASEYLSRLSPDQLNSSNALMFMMHFPTSNKIKSYALTYIEGLTVEDYNNKLNQQFIISFGGYPDVKKAIKSKLLPLKANQINSLTNLFLLFRSDTLMRKKVIAYYNQLSKQDVFQRKNLLLCYTFNRSTEDPWFRLFYNKIFWPKLDSSIRSVSVPGMYYGRVKDLANNAFINDYLLPYMTKASAEEKVDWQQLRTKCKKKFRKDFVDENILLAQVRVLEYLKIKDEKYRAKYIRLRLLEGEKYGWDTTSPYIEANYVNNFLWYDLFMHSADKDQLLIGAKWMAGIIQRNPDANLFDTYANLLYKAGKTEEAIEWEKKALAMTNVVKGQQLYQNDIEKNLEKMKKGEPTWISAPD
jgi:thioredoxin-related protein